MRDRNSWSISLMRWGGLNIRLHMLFLLFGAVTFYLSCLHAQTESNSEMVQYALISLGVLFVSVLFHELAHYQASLMLGGSAGAVIVLGPLGGLEPIRSPHNPKAELLIQLAGPLCNLAICLLCVPFLWGKAEVDLLGLLHPISPAQIVEGGRSIVVLKLVFWVNWVMAAVNLLLPAFPFDLGQALKAFFVLRQGDENRNLAAYWVGYCAKGVSLGLLVAAWFVRDQQHGVVPAWFALVLLAIFLFFSARKEETQQEEFDAEEDFLGYDFSQGYTSLEQSAQPRVPAPSPLMRWLERRRQARLHLRSEQEAEEESRVDGILARLHEHGIESLAKEERRLLERVSARYRDRTKRLS